MWLAGVLTAVIIALASLALINRLVYGPEGQVRAYFAAVREGDGSKALGILGAQVPEADASMLDGDALRASLEGVHQLQTTDTVVRDGGERATVTVSYQVNDQRHSSEFNLHKVGSHWGVFDQWAIDQGTLPTVHVDAKALSAATLNGQKVAVKGGSQDFAVTFPGVYQVTYESALYSSVSDSTLITAPGEAPALTLDLEPSPTAVASVRQQVKTYLDTCAAQNSLYPTGCPFEYAFNGRVAGDLTWLITEYPEPEINLANGAWSLSESQGKAEISFTALDLYTGKKEQVNQEVIFEVAGSLATADETVTFTPAT